MAKEDNLKTASDVQATTQKEVQELYNTGSSIYAIAEKVYGFESEEAVIKIKKLLGKEELI
jgi:hypothetical protein